jgi:dTDP-4-amino-4,6-dideoxy-D-galactose acyltransferase
MDAQAICEFLDWDSKFFGRRIARLVVPCLTEKAIAAIDSWCCEHRIDCLYFLAGSSDQRTARLAQENGFRFVDARVTLDVRITKACGTGDSAPGTLVRNAVEADIDALKTIARRSHRDSRFYFDGNFPVQRCDELYETWIEKSCRGWAKNVLVATNQGEIEGYISCHVPSVGSGQIGLVGVSEKAQGKGVGRELLINAIRWFWEEGVEVASVATQGRNVRAQRLYQRCGFATRSVELWFHRWSSEAPQRDDDYAHTF